MDFYQRFAEPKPPRPALPYKVVIASQPTDDEYNLWDFWAYRAFARACPDHGIPVDTWIPGAVMHLARQAFQAGSEALWEAARQLLNPHGEKVL